VVVTSALVVCLAISTRSSSAGKLQSNTSVPVASFRVTLSLESEIRVASRAGSSAGVNVWTPDPASFQKLIVANIQQLVQFRSISRRPKE
jgi:hypothetical protein